MVFGERVVVCFDLGNEGVFELCVWWGVLKVDRMVVVCGEVGYLDCLDFCGGFENFKVYSGF